MNHIGTENIAKHETSLRDYANSKLCELDFLNIQGKAPDKGAIFSFTLNGAGHPHDISTIIDQRGIAVRAGHHCAQPLMKHIWGLHLQHVLLLRCIILQKKLISL